MLPFISARRGMLLAAAGILAASFLRAGQGQPAAYKTGPGPFEVAVRRFEWTEKDRDREVPVKIYYPKTGTGPFPVILFSHGLGGTRDAGEYHGRYWAGHGYVCVHVQHHGSDDAVWKGSRTPLADMRQALRDPTNAVNRPLDVRFVLDRLAEVNRTQAGLKGRLDLERVGMAGHSFGAWTTQMVIGEVHVTARGQEMTLADPRVKAAVIMSPSGQRPADPDKTFGSIRVPCLHLTGTEDSGMALTETTPADRRLPYDHIRRAPQYLVIFKGGDHMTFADSRGGLAGGARDPRFHELILLATTAFWDAYLKGDARARQWLEGGGFRRELAADGTFEQKKPAGE